MFEFLGVADWLIWYMISQYVGLAVVAVYLLYKTRFKIGFKAVFLRKVGVSKDSKSEDTAVRVGDYQVVGEKEFKSTDKSISFRKGSFSPDLEHIAYRKHGFQYVFFDFDTGSLLTFGGEFEGVDAPFAERHLRAGVLREFLLGAGSLPKMFWVVFIISVVTTGVSCLIGGYLIGKEGLLAPEMVSLFGCG